VQALNDTAEDQPGDKLSALPAQEVETLVQDLVLYLLIADRRKVPIKRPDIVKNVMKVVVKQVL